MVTNLQNMILRGRAPPYYNSEHSNRYSWLNWSRVAEWGYEQAHVEKAEAGSQAARRVRNSSPRWWRLWVL